MKYIYNLYKINY